MGWASWGTRAARSGHAEFITPLPLRSVSSFQAHQSPWSSLHFTTYDVAALTASSSAPQIGAEAKRKR